MKGDPRLEDYLTSLERVLRPLPVSDRAEIITEIKSHILSSLERDPNAQLDSVLSALGEPEIVANRYLLERGLKPTKPSISPIVKWMVIGFLGTFAMSLIFVGVVLVKFTPLLRVDDLGNKVVLLGGLIEVDGKTGRTFGIKGSWKERSMNGSLGLGDNKAVSVKFGNGRFAFENSADGKLAWECRVTGSGAQEIQPIKDKNGVNLDFSLASGVDCTISVPALARLSLEGGNGKILFEEPRYSIDANVTNGKIDVEPDESQDYRYSVAVANGKMDSFVSSDKKEAHVISIHLTNGMISREN